MPVQHPRSGGSGHLICGVGSSDLLLRYLGDNVIFDGEAHVMAKELL